MVRKSNIDMLNRKIYNYLRNFFEIEKKALLVSGARQVGKTFAIRKVGKECFADVVEFNFLNNSKYREAFKSPSDAKEILLRLSALAEKKLTPGNTLVFFDEVHRHMTRPFNDDLHIIFPGDFSQLTQCAQLGELSFIVGIGDRARTQTVAQ